MLGNSGDGDVAKIERRDHASALSAGFPYPEMDGNCDLRAPSPSMSVQVPPSHSLAVQVPSFPSLSAQVLPAGSTFDKK